jgi:nicotinate phosphoribosyltransferase
MSFAYGNALLTDLYQLTMMQAYFERGMNDTAVFELFVRRLPATRSFLVAAGLEQTLDFLEQLRFDEWELEWLRKSGRFSHSFVDSLASLRFTGDVDAMPEGTVCFAGEPLLRVTAPLPEAQLVETRIINMVHFQTVVASKAARSVLVAPGKLLVDFGLRRAHGGEAGMLAARAAYLAGFAGTSNVLAGARWGIPTFGTMAHSFVEAHDDERAAFLDYARANPTGVTLLLDTYDTEAAARKVVALATQLAGEGIRIRSVRLNSGSHVVHARAVRRILDDGGLPDVELFASGNLDEYQLFELQSAGAPIDGFGVGTHLVTSNDAPSLDCAYKLMEYAGRPRYKRSEGKATLPGRKQVHRIFSRSGKMHCDEVTLADEELPGATPLLEPVMRRGQRLAATSLRAARARAADQLTMLPSELRHLRGRSEYPVRISERLLAFARDAYRGLYGTAESPLP